MYRILKQYKNYLPLGSQEKQPLSKESSRESHLESCFLCDVYVYLSNTNKLELTRQIKIAPTPKKDNPGFCTKVKELMHKSKSLCSLKKKKKSPAVTNKNSMSSLKQTDSSASSQSCAKCKAKGELCPKNCTKSQTK
ncbi:unnamed protein product [Leptidea sinapis]|uniref:Uncharacterized protein n=1 Tax=Leptidea sinapis TaxID=189913 RepID=A0A5E4R7G3_9NEOP|nr:unnamed protein product [Leptidea sinapis]